MTIYEPNPNVSETGAEVDEFLDAPPRGDDEEEAVAEDEDPEASLD